MGLAGKWKEEMKKGEKERSGWKSQAAIHLERVAASMSKPPWNEAGARLASRAAGPHGARLGDNSNLCVSGALCTWGQSALR